MKPILTLFLLLWLTLPLAGQNAQDPDLDILLSLTSRTVRHDNSGSYILFTTDRDGEQKVYTQEILAIDCYNYLVRALHLGRYRYGVMDILGNLVCRSATPASRRFSPAGSGGRARPSAGGSNPPIRLATSRSG